ncbi:TonB-dependent receptor domain-containing protein [Oceaniovalibus sp. ACAM 378]|uniref:TonB-dependent receptor domain-containing protein n=1 Tax=Oceaniovalibus sp. ACAM 378 TaxID=2599923 RepID=UPI0011D86A68|nr:TonB-dependent receptor [Oceaniovalibus sp. ACAM 378]TYB86693.1 TonB-dependent receptor [Oceaniovalibus sp. ACAM 378]
MNTTPAGTRALLFGTTSLIIFTFNVGALAAQETEGGFLGTLVLGESKRQVQTDTAVPVTYVDQDEIDDRQAGTVAELIDSVPGVSLVNGSTPQGSGINIRGFGANSTFGTDSKVAVQVDGASVGAEKLYRIGTQLFTDPFLYKSVSVIRGTVGSFEYGSGIVGGVVKLETKDASDLTGGEIGFALGQTLEFSSNGNGVASSSVLGWQPTQDMEILLNYTWRDQDNQKDGSGGTIGNSAFTLPSGLIKAKYTFGQNRDQSLTLSFAKTTASDRDVPFDSFTTTSDSFGTVDRDTDSTTAVLKYNFNPISNDLIDLDVILSHADQQIDQRYVPGSSPFEGTPAGAGIIGLVGADHRYQTTKLAFKNTSLFDTGAVRHDLRTGLEFIRRERLDASTAAGGVDRRVAIFAVDDMRIGDAWTVTPALRYETSKITGSTAPNDGIHKNDALMGGVSVRYAFGSGLALFGNAAYTEGLPIIDDLSTASAINQSEKSRTFEIGASYDRTDLFQSGDTFAIKGVIYQTTLNDVTSYLVPGVRPPAPTLDKIETEGLELELSYAMEIGLYMDLNANLVKGTEFGPGMPATDWRSSPADSVRVTLGKKFGDELDLSWEVVANKSIDTGTAAASGFGIHNLRATYIPQDGVLKDTQIRIGVENAFDRDYTPHLSTRPAPGRNIKLSLSRVF